VGFTHWYKELGTARIFDYQTPLSAFTFLWRQSRRMLLGELSCLDEYPIISSFAVFCSRCICSRGFASRELLSGAALFWRVFLLVPLLAGRLLLNQSCLRGIPLLGPSFALPVYARLVAFLAGCSALVCHRNGGAQRHYGVLAQFCTYYSFVAKFSISSGPIPSFH